jgi:hypothetical protein
LLNLKNESDSLRFFGLKTQTPGLFGRAGGVL